MFERQVRALAAKAGVRVCGPNECVNSEAKATDIVVMDQRFFREVVLNGSIGLGESFMRGYWTCGDLAGLTEKILRADIGRGVHGGFGAAASPMNI